MSTPLPSDVERPQVWAVGGGKGGTGKSLVAASLGIHLAQTGRRVILIDGDLGGPNLHTFLGIDPPRVALSDFINRRVDSLEEAAVETGVPRLRIVSGARNSLDADGLKHFQKTRLLRLLLWLPADVVVVDLGAGTSLNVLDLFSMADQGLLVILPEPTSVENCYRFLKAAYLRRLQHLCRVLGYEPIMDLVLRHRGGSPTVNPGEVLEEIDRVDAGAATILQSHLETFAPHLIVNQARDQEDVALGDSMQAASERFIRIPVQFSGAIPHDPGLVRCVKTRRPFLLEYPRSRAAAAIRAAAESVAARARLRPCAAPERRLGSTAA
jgi:flagellar biosynthesis protein FlhG